jgi:chaperonin GroES
MAKKKAKSVKKSSPKKAAQAASKSTQSRTAKAPIQPLSDRVLVRREDMPDKKSAAGIVLPDTAQKEKSKMGIVLAVGAGRLSDEGQIIPMSVAVGDRVIFNAGWDNEVSMEDDREHFLVRETDILAVLN